MMALLEDERRFVQPFDAIQALDGQTGRRMDRMVYQYYAGVSILR